MNKPKIDITLIENLLQEGVIAKENQDFRTAAGIFTDVIIYSHDLNYPHGVLHGLLNMGSIWKLKTRDVSSPDFARFARLNFLEAAEYAKTHDLPEEEVIHAKFLLGQAEIELGNFAEATSLYQEAYDYYTRHPRSKAHTGDIRRHLGTALTKTGKLEEGITMIEKGLEAIRTYDEADTYDKRNYVWETGALLALSEAYITTDIKKARKFAEEALQIATEKDLTIRKEQSRKAVEMLNKV